MSLESELKRYGRICNATTFTFYNKNDASTTNEAYGSYDCLQRFCMPLWRKLQPCAISEMNLAIAPLMSAYRLIMSVAYVWLIFWHHQKALEILCGGVLVFSAGNNFGGIWAYSSSSILSQQELVCVAWSFVFGRYGALILFLVRGPTVRGYTPAFSLALVWLM